MKENTMNNLALEITVTQLTRIKRPVKTSLKSYIYIYEFYTQIHARACLCVLGFAPGYTLYLDSISSVPEI